VSPTFTSSMQIVHSALPFSPIIFWSTVFLGRDDIASAVAGPGAELPVCSISCDIILSKSS
jgi:hypothetical protein